MTATLATAFDVMKERPAFFRAPRKPELVDLPEAAYLMANGQGSPEFPAFQETIAALFNVAYTLKFACKKDGRDFKVATFEGSWSFQDGSQESDRDRWQWQLILMVPDFVRERDVAAAQQAVEKRKGRQREISLHRFAQGLCVQMLNIGPYDAEEETLVKLRSFMEANGLRSRGPHHEVYLGNPQRAKPEKLKTLLRLPVEAA